MRPGGGHALLSCAGNPVSLFVMLCKQARAQEHGLPIEPFSPEACRPHTLLPNDNCAVAGEGLADVLLPLGRNTVGYGDNSPLRFAFLLGLSQRQERS